VIGIRERLLRATTAQQATSDVVQSTDKKRSGLIQTSIDANAFLEHRQRQMKEKFTKVFVRLRCSVARFAVLLLLRLLGD